MLNVETTLMAINYYIFQGKATVNYLFESTLGSLFQSNVATADFSKIVSSFW